VELEAIDVIDRKIIDQLRIDGRRSFGEIGRYVGLSEGSVRARYKRLRDLGVVQVVAMSTASRMGMVEAHLTVRVRGVALESVAKALAAFPEVKYVAASIGASDLIADVRFEDSEALGVFVTDTLRRVHGVLDVETVMTIDVLKDEYVWAGFRDPVDRPTRPHPATGTGLP